MKTLNLTLSKLPFDVMVTDEKKREFREDKPSKTGKYWMHSRLHYPDGKEKIFDNVRFANGYGATKPYFVCEYLGWTYANEDYTQEYSNGLVVAVKRGDFVIKLGKIIESGNLK